MVWLRRKGTFGPWWARCAIAALLLSPVGSAPAAEIEGVRFAERVAVGPTDLELRSLGLLRYRLVFKAYVAALYLPPQVSAEAALEDVPKRLEIEYFWPIEAADFGRAADRILERSFEAAELAPLRERLAALHARFEPVEPGDRYALTYVPGLGTELSKNGRRLAVIPGPDFAAAYFAIWLGSDPVDRGLKEKLLDGFESAPGGEA